jgi:hypothetical protein
MKGKVIRMELSISIYDVHGKLLAQNMEQGEVGLVYQQAYQEGDTVVINSAESDKYLKVQIDDALGQAFLYITAKEIIYRIPFGEKRSSYSPKVFSGNLHYLWAREATQEEILEYKNLAVNVMDQHQMNGCYPHASANVETRGEAVFAARNAIDGVRENHSHGGWPYQSWGINRQDDARIRVDFGRMVRIDKILLYTRADFPHDNWWKEVTLQFSDGSELVWELEKTDKAHVIPCGNLEVMWLELCNLIKSEDPSPFPALTQIEVYGVEIVSG